MNSGLAEMMRYNRWANRELFDACRELRDEQLNAHPPGISGSIRELLVHIAGGQQTFVLRTKGRQHEGEFGRESPWPGWESLLAAFGESSDELVGIAEAMDDDAQVDLPFMDKTFRFPGTFFLVHAVAHGAEHRTEMKAGLAQLGVETPDLDGWNYAAAMGYGQEV